MKIRELLQTELWSKRTSRKMLVWSGSILGFVVAILAIWLATEWFWLTPGERKVGRVALRQIDELQSFESINQQDFDKRSKLAEREVDAANEAAWTWHDRGVATALSAYLGLTQLGQEDLQRRKTNEQTHPVLAQRDVEYAEEMVTAGKEERLTVRLLIHGALN